jgi:hypothetical protein
MARIKGSGRYARIGAAVPYKLHNLSTDSSTVLRSVVIFHLASFYNVTDFP